VTRYELDRAARWASWEGLLRVPGKVPSAELPLTKRGASRSVIADETPTPQKAP
jgi:hypothetical protein